MVAEALRQGQKMHPTTPDTWIRKGVIPEWRWSIVRALVKISERKLHEHNERGRANGARK